MADSKSKEKLTILQPANLLVRKKNLLAPVKIISLKGKSVRSVHSGRFPFITLRIEPSSVAILMSIKGF